MSNPYQSPQFAGPIAPGMPPGVDRDKLRRVARFQRWALYALLMNIITYVGFLVVQALKFEALAAVAALLLMTSALVGLIAVFLLAKEVYHIVVCILCAVFMLVPCIGLLILLAVNQRATNYLQMHGIKVGFMGANPNQI